MIRTALASLLALLLLPLSSWAETIRIDDRFLVRFDLPSGWVLSTEPPRALVEETAEHLKHELEGQDRQPGEDQILAVAAKRLAANEAFVYNPATLAHLSIDFSALNEGEKAPSKKTVRLSAEYAGEGLKEEEGTSEVRTSVDKIPVAGADLAYRLDASYRHHGEPVTFVGIVGFAQPYWFYLYYNDHQKAAQDKEAFETLLRSLRLQVANP